MVYDVKQSKSVAYARAVAVLCFYRLACFRFAADKAASPVYDVKQSKSVADVSKPEFSARIRKLSANVVNFPQNHLRSLEYSLGPLYSRRGVYNSVP